MAVACPYCGQDMEYLTVNQVARLMGVTPKTVRNRIKAGWYPGSEKVYNVNGSAYRIPATAVLATLRERND